MDKRVLRERMRRKKRQMMIRHYTKIGLCVIGMILAVVFVVRGIIIPIAHHVAGGGSSDQTVQAQADTEEVQANSDAAVRQPLKGKSDTDKIAAMTAGWHEDANGKWYQNTDGTYFSNGFQDIDGVTYSFDENGYIQTGWVEKGVKDYYFNEDGSYDPSKVRPMLALTFDDGPGEYTDELLDCLEQNNAHATFFMLGQNVSSYPDAPKRMLELGCEIGSHSWDHTQLTTIDLDAVAKQFSDTDDALIQACGQAASVARAPYGDGNSDIYNTVNKPFFMWSLDTEDWKLLDADADYSAVMNGDLTDGTIILMHDIHEPSVKAALRLIPDLIAQGYKLVTVSEMAEAKNVTLQNACYVDFWPSTLSNGDVPGYQGGSDAAASADGTDGTSDASTDSSDGSEDYSDGSSDSGDGSSDDSTYMTILAVGNYRIKGKVSETNVNSLNEGDPVIVRSRVDDSQTWKGTISSIKTDATADDSTESSDEMAYDDSSDGSTGETASKYNFYVKLDDDNGLMMGQHVLVEPDNGQDEKKDGMWLPAAYIKKSNGKYYVWLDSHNKLKLQEIKVGEYDENLDEYEVKSGLKTTDYIACDDSTLKEGMRVTRVAPEDSTSDYGEEQTSDDAETFGADDYDSYEGDTSDYGEDTYDSGYDESIDDGTDAGDDSFDTGSDSSDIVDDGTSDSDVADFGE